MRRLLLGVVLLTACSGSEEQRVVVPGVAMTHSVTRAYEVLHEAGFKVAVPEHFAVSSLIDPMVRRQSPRAGERVERGSVVELELWGGPIGSAVSRRHGAEVGNFVGLAATEAVRRINVANLYFELPELPPLPPSSAPHLLHAYRVTWQRPEPGARLRTGVLEGRGFRVTPVILSVELRR